MKSQVNDLLAVAVCVYIDATAKCAATNQERDLITIRSRVEHEGLSFLTITLPNFGKDFDEALSKSGITASHFQSFRKCGQIPSFLKGIVGKVFDKTTGRIYDDPDISAIEAVRQIAYCFKKLEVACSPPRIANAISSFLLDELDLREPVDSSDVERFSRVASVLWGTTLGFIVSSLDSIPKHGPGSTQERIQGNKKYTAPVWHERLEPYFPMFHFRFPNEGAYETPEFNSVTLVSPDCEQPVKVITVPKTLKSPRIIAIEPVCMQYTQQALAQVLVKVLESSWLTKGHINFTDQSINQKLAMKSSADRSLATIDLSSASDRVPYTLALRMFDSQPDFQAAIDACRTRDALLPTGELVHLRKFASMGSALCFPIESMYFYTLCIGARLGMQGLPVTPLNIFKVSRDVYVYGDDIIIPTDEAAAIVAYLRKYYCKVSAHKSYWTGRFRESCGVDAFAGELVTPIYIRQTPPNNRRSSASLVSWVATSNLFYRKGYWLTSSYLMKRCESILGKIPIMGPKASGLGKVSFQHLVSSERWNKDLQRVEVHAWCAVPTYRIDKLEGYSALLKVLLSLEAHKASWVDNVYPLDRDNKNLQRTARYGTVTLKRRWTRPY